MKLASLRFNDQLAIYLCETRDRARLIARLITRSRGLARLDTVWYQHIPTWQVLLLYYVREG